MKKKKLFLGFLCAFLTLASVPLTTFAEEINPTSLETGVIQPYAVTVPVNKSYNEYYTYSNDLPYVINIKVTGSYQRVNNGSNGYVATNYSNITATAGVTVDEGGNSCSAVVTNVTCSKAANGQNVNVTVRIAVSVRDNGSTTTRNITKTYTV